ncbi:cytochrome P450 [Aspergillus alliaceus]|uniref:cytochrome P450 n=1 Tax=Petromyces alliaceus TaxID=209559 RepID=UPI0012A72492|nr:cytochrome P450 [Aspergillus alliaceus]KAB8236162.1 cytochrome P450 [Aspergillus alliaceus]
MTPLIELLLRTYLKTPLLLSTGVIACLVIAYSLVWVIYNLYFHPLRHFPGPLEARATRIWYCRKLLSGKVSFEIGKVHAKYGDVVRIAPDELSFNDPNAWNDIYGYRQGKGEFDKDPVFYSVTSSGRLSIVGAPTKRHGELRRMMAHGFSDRSLREQVPIIKSYGDKFFNRLHELSRTGKPVDMVKWYNFLTFDVIGDLAFGSSFDCLETSQYHSWISIVFDNIKLSAYLRCTLYYPRFLRPILRQFIPSHLTRHREKHMRLTREKAMARWNLKNGRPDLLDRLTKPNSGISEAEFIQNCATVVVAGSDTTANVLAGTTHFLSQNRRCYDKLAHEVRSRFKSEDEITLDAVCQLEYLTACLTEGMRRYPPTPAHLPRRTNMNDNLSGRLVPKNTTVSLTQVVMYHTEKYFHRPYDFCPERWLGDPEFASDRREALQAFSYGPRGCIGRNLAMIELRLTIARLMWNFDFDPIPGYENWHNQNIYLGWQKVPLPIQLRPRAYIAKDVNGPISAQ